MMRDLFTHGKQFLLAKFLDACLSLRSASVAATAV
jgi:hypothetical protein